MSRKKGKGIILVLLVVAILVFTNFSVTGNILPHERYGVAYIDGVNSPDDYTVTSWIHGVQFGSTNTFNGDGSFSIDTYGDDTSDITCKYGGLDGDSIVYRINTGENLYIADENNTFNSGGMEYGDLNFYSTDQPSSEVKINELVAQPGDSGNQYVYIYDPVGIDKSRWRLEDHDGWSAEIDTLTTDYDGNLLYVDLGSTSVLDQDADEIILSWDPLSTGINQNNWAAMDRVEYGYQTTQPDNTTLPDHPSSIGIGQGLARYSPGVDTNDCQADFILQDETGRIEQATPPSITLTVPNGGERWDVDTEHDITWSTQSGDGNITGVDLDYSVDGGISWNTIVTDSDDDGIFSWMIPDDPSTDCLVRATVHDDQPESGTDTSDGVFEIIGIPPAQPKRLKIYHNGTDDEDNNLTWYASSDDGNGDDDVDHYNIYRSDKPDGPWNSTTLIRTHGAADDETYSYIDSDKGKVDSTDWWYLLRSVDSNGLMSSNSNPAREPKKITMDLFSSTLNSKEVTSPKAGDSDGWEFISLDFLPFNTSLTSILNDPENGISGSYDKVMFYDSIDGKWYSYKPGRAEHFNDIDDWDQKMGIWIHMTADNSLVVEGNPLGVTNITLNPGWNMVGYPSGNSGNNGLPSEVAKVGYFNASGENNLAYNFDPSSFIFEPNNAYWIYNGADYEVTWTVEY